ncbi:MAG: HYC_CC_PP family protein [Bacteroidia bacterium]
MKILQKITAVFLALVFLLSSMSFTVSSMVCLKSGKGKVSFSIQKNCCKKKEIPSKGTYFTKGDCCDINNVFIRLHDFNPSKKLHIEQPIAVSSTHLYVADKIFSCGDDSSLHYTDLPPPYHGRMLLNLISTYRI